MAALVNDDRIYETSTTTGTGSYALAGAVTGFQPFSVIGAANYCWYFATDDVNWEAGIGTYSASPDTLARTQVIYSSNGDAAVDWAAGTRKIRCGLTAWAAAPQILSKSVAGSSNVTLTAYEQRRKVLVLTGALTGNIDVIVDTTVWDWIVYNNTSGAYTVTMKVSGQAGVQLEQGRRRHVYCDGTDVREIGRVVPIVLAKSGTAVAAPADTSENTVATITVPANAMGANGVLRWAADLTCTNNANGKTINVKIGGSTIASYALASLSGSSMNGWIRNANATNAQVANSVNLLSNNGVNVQQSASAAIDTTSSTTVTITVTKATAGDTVTLTGYQVEVIGDGA